ncbi:PhzF family phenazine biosynthesis protein [Sporolactobacillus shoreicorticis]|uniref:PhzF family phenazine biosynthesis protein n=1 Tax=Sporolactobacillus shoreicorticis TaxID=1923877 RepID=A0ABW5S7E3_9BACL|nr:PhzF family phenazine biosynthesis protein [Sporolactobacillus shoreicorticis]MCO7127571.1 PhzF family phenazine biosynthesis protein [Sporolactobacillus shoreicorticis]
MNNQGYTLDAFTKNGSGGNPAGVVLESDLLGKSEMQMVARKIGLSETAFVQHSNDADFKMSYFTPNSEVNLCGHATIAAFSLMRLEKKVSIGSYTLETKAGLLKATICDDNQIYLSQTLPNFYEQPDKEEIARSLNVSTSDFDENLPIEVVSTGLRDILVPIKNVRLLNKIKPDFSRIINVSKKYQVIGYHLFTLNTENNLTAYCRNFAPLYSIPEESATGTSTGALTCYLYKYNKTKGNEMLSFEQGYSMKRASSLFSKLTVKNRTITRIEVGGTASNVRRQNISI